MRVGGGSLACSLGCLRRLGRRAISGWILAQTVPRRGHGHACASGAAGNVPHGLIINLTLCRTPKLELSELEKRRSRLSFSAPVFLPCAGSQRLGAAVSRILPCRPSGPAGQSRACHSCESSMVPTERYVRRLAPDRLTRGRRRPASSNALSSRMWHAMRNVHTFIIQAFILRTCFLMPPLLVSDWRGGKQPD
jgi:hypothetical protein